MTTWTDRLEKVKVPENWGVVLIPVLLVVFNAYFLQGRFSLGKLLITGMIGYWLSTGPIFKNRVVPALLYLLTVVIASFFSADVWLSFWGIFGTYSHGLLAAMVLIPFYVCFDISSRPAIEKGIRVGAVIMSLVGIGQRFGVGWCPFPLFTGDRVYATLGSPIDVGAICALCFPFARTAPEKVLLVLCLWASGSRGAWIATALGAIYYYWPVISPRIRIWGLILSGVGLISAMTYRPPSDLGRVAVYHAAVSSFFARPWLGWGPGNFLMVAELWRNPLWDEVYGPTTQDHAHNLFLEALSTSGIIGFIGLCILLWILWSRSDRPARSGLLGLFIVGMLNPLFMASKAIALMLCASSEKKEPATKPQIMFVKSMSLISLALVFMLIHWDIMIKVHGKYPWSVSSIISAYYLGIIKETPTRLKFKL